LFLAGAEVVFGWGGGCFWLGRRLFLAGAAVVFGWAAVVFGWAAADFSRLRPVLAACGRF
jgi:hypothetical protein